MLRWRYPWTCQWCPIILQFVRQPCCSTTVRRLTCRQFVATGRCTTSTVSDRRSRARSLSSSLLTPATSSSCWTTRRWRLCWTMPRHWNSLLRTVDVDVPRGTMPNDVPSKPRHDDSRRFTDWSALTKRRRHALYVSASARRVLVSRYPGVSWFANIVAQVWQSVTLIETNSHSVYCRRHCQSLQQ